MGSSLSSEEVPLNQQEQQAGNIPIRKRKYQTPDTREKERLLVSNEATNVQNTFETATDKFDYLIVFRLTEGVNAINEDAEEQPWEDDVDESGNKREGFKTQWLQCLASDNVKMREESLKAIEKQYSLRNREKKLSGYRDRTEKPKAKKGEWLAMARAVIIDRLSIKVGWGSLFFPRLNHCFPSFPLPLFHRYISHFLAYSSSQGGLQLKVGSIRSGCLMVRLRAPIKLLEQQADIDDYKLEFKPEIDPGSEEFWNREVNRLVPVIDANGKTLSQKQVVRVAVEGEEEKRDMTRTEAERVLRDLHR